MGEAQHIQRTQTDTHVPGQPPTRTRQHVQPVADLLRLPAWTRSWGNQPPPWLRLPPSLLEQKPVQRHIGEETQQGELPDDTIAVPQGFISPQGQPSQYQPRGDVQRLVIQRYVKSSSASGQTSYYSHLDPSALFPDSGQAQRYETLLERIDWFRQVVNLPLGQNLSFAASLHEVIPGIKKVAIGGIALYLVFPFPDWIPPDYRTNFVRGQLIALATLAVKKRPEPASNYTKWDKDTCLTGCRMLIDDGYAGAETLYESIRQAFDRALQTGQPGDWAIVNGWRYQLYETLQRWVNYELVAVEVPYGISDPITGMYPRADVQLIGDEFIDYKSYASDTENEEIKKGFWSEFEKYAGTIGYGGISRPFRYVFAKGPPTWIRDNIGNAAQQVRKIRPWAFPGGLWLNDVQVLPPLEAFDWKPYLQSVLPRLLKRYTTQASDLGTVNSAASFVALIQDIINTWSEYIARTPKLSKPLDVELAEFDNEVKEAYDRFFQIFDYANNELTRLWYSYGTDGAYWSAASPDGNQQGLQQWHKRVKTIIDTTRRKAHAAITYQSAPVDQALLEGEVLLVELKEQVAQHPALGEEMELEEPGSPR